MKTVVGCAMVMLGLTMLALIGGYLLGRLSRQYQEPPTQPQNADGVPMLARFVLLENPFPKRVAICARCSSTEHHVSDCPEGDRS